MLGVLLVVGVSAVLLMLLADAVVEASVLVVADVLAIDAVVVVIEEVVVAVVALVVATVGAVVVAATIVVNASIMAVDKERPQKSRWMCSLLYITRLRGGKHIL